MGSQSVIVRHEGFTVHQVVNDRKELRLVFIVSVVDADFTAIEMQTVRGNKIIKTTGLRIVPSCEVWKWYNTISDID